MTEAQAKLGFVDQLNHYWQLIAFVLALVLTLAAAAGSWWHQRLHHDAPEDATEARIDERLTHQGKKLDKVEDRLNEALEIIHSIPRDR